MLSVSEIANIIGVEETIIRQTLKRRDADLLPYLHDQASEGEGTTSETPLLDLEGLPQLITKLAFNISPSDIIENLACQVLHLLLVQNENNDLAAGNKALQQQNEQLQQRSEELQQTVASLRTEVTALKDTASYKGILGFLKRRK